MIEDCDDDIQDADEAESGQIECGDHGVQISEATVEVQSDDGYKFEYSVKIINPNRMSEFKSVRICKWKQCKTLDDLRSFLSAKVPSVGVNDEKPDFAVVDIGYIEPGHGMKGRKQWLNSDDDVNEMYSNHTGRRNILLWAYSHARNPGPAKKGESNFETHKKSLGEVDDKYEELKKIHGTKYTPEQLRMWAHMIRLGKHESTDEPPDLPFWRGRKRQQVNTDPQPTKRAAVVADNISSNTSRVSMRSELLDQLSKWYKLNADGVVSDSEYEELKKTILSDIKQL